MKIPGWKEVSKKDAVGFGYDGKLLAPQVVDGKWYIPDEGGSSLQKLWDEYIELVWSDYHFHTFAGKGGKRFGVVSDGDIAIRVLKECGKLDEDGNKTEGDTMKAYPDNERGWQVGDAVIHKADAKQAFMLMTVVKIQKNGRMQTRYISPGLIWNQHRNVPFILMPKHAKDHYGKIWRNSKSELLDPADFGIVVPENYDHYWEVT